MEVLPEIRRERSGETYQCCEGDVSVLPAGHDAWVIGGEPAVVIAFQGMLDKELFR